MSIDLLLTSEHYAYTTDQSSLPRAERYSMQYVTLRNKIHVKIISVAQRTVRVAADPNSRKKVEGARSNCKDYNK